MTNPNHTDTSRSGDLKPCPFCGSAFKIGQEPHDNFPVSGMYYIYHDYGPLGSAARRCPVGVSGHFTSADEAIAVWNNRPADRIEALEAENERMVLTIRKLQGHQSALEADNKLLREALIHTAGICNPASGFLKNTTGVRKKHIKNVCSIACAALGEKQ